jgi:hypothetical protein
MNSNGRPQRVSYEELEPQLRQLREAGLGLKVIGEQLGYSEDHVKKLCRVFKIYKNGLKPKRVLAREQQTASVDSAMAERSRVSD